MAPARDHPQPREAGGSGTGRTPPDPGERPPTSDGDEPVELPTRAHPAQPPPATTGRPRVPIWMASILVLLAAGMGLGIGYLMFGSPFTSSEAWEADSVSAAVMKAWRTGDEADINAIYASDVLYTEDGRLVAAGREEISTAISRALLFNHTYQQVGPVAALTAWDGDLYVVSLVETTYNPVPRGEPLMVYYRVEDGMVTRHVVVSPYG